MSKRRQHLAVLGLVLAVFFAGWAALGSGCGPYQAEQVTPAQTPKPQAAQYKPPQRGETAPSPALRHLRPLGTTGRHFFESIQRLKKGLVARQRELHRKIRQIKNRIPREPPPYRISPGDVIEIVYHMFYGPQKKAKYRLEVQDVIRVEFFVHRELNRQVTLRSDGRVSLPLVGDVYAAGLTADELRDKLSKQYARFVLRPKVNIYLVRFNVKIDELKRSITTAARGQSKIVPVRPDGRISLPLIGDVLAAGLTVPQLRTDIIRRYKPLVANLDVTVIVKNLTSPKIYIHGEVTRPGELVVTGPTPLSTIISRAQGFNRTADPSRVLVLRRQAENPGETRPLAMRINYRAVMNGDSSKDIMLIRNDLVFVPRKDQNKVYVLGEVVTPGIVTYDRSLTVSQAIAASRGHTVRARLDSVLVLRRVPGRRPTAFRVDYEDVIKNGNVMKDVTLKTNDVVYVPKSFIAKVNDFINQWFTRGVYALFPAGSSLQFLMDLDSVMHLHRRTFAY
ncbi:MAG: polysaccharide biosynthesis/export family protein [Proteobacteria bacterium]|nr:polysaccharide biosynthesis/export family protein [Pseudomonadota bacterium]MBU1741849.1 polysaccharide biosynthesis/export family protein [Pseudomonadota bacterium]